MKNLTQVEFEEQIERLLNGEITRKKLAKELETDIRTLNGKITELSETNPTLYQIYITKFPYQPKTREDIDFEALIIRLMKKNLNLDIVSEEYKISRRTISRRIKELEKTNPDLVETYREYAYSLKRGKDVSLLIRERIKQYEEKPVRISTITEKKEEQLRDTIAKFEELKSTGISNAEAARRLGYDGFPTIWKKYKEMERIETEKSVEEASFRDRIKVDDSQLVTEVDKDSAERTDREETGNELEGK